RSLKKWHFLQSERILFTKPGRHTLKPTRQLLSQPIPGQAVMLSSRSFNGVLARRLRCEEATRPKRGSEGWVPRKSRPSPPTAGARPPVRGTNPGWLTKTPDPQLSRI